VLARCDWWSSNEREAALLTGIADDPSAAARALTARTGNVIVRAGALGCFLALSAVPGTAVSGTAVSGTAVSGTVVHVPAPAVQAVDTTGAGDAHAGAFLAALAEGLAPTDAARRANAAAAFAVTRNGPATSPTRATLDAWLAAPTRLSTLPPRV
jgi:sugar/nucleoside kinase (ribokinase family)